MRRIATTLVWAVVMGASTACTSAGSTDPGCGECVDEMAEVRKQIKALPDVKQLLTLKKYGASPTNGATVRAEIVSSATGDTGVADEVIGLIEGDKAFWVFRRHEYLGGIFYSHDRIARCVHD